MTARQLTFWEEIATRRNQLPAAQLALLERIEAALARMEARGHHLQLPFTLSDGEEYGYARLARIRDAILNGEEYVSRPLGTEQMELIAAVAMRIPSAVSHSSGKAAWRDTKKTPAQIVDEFPWKP